MILLRPKPQSKMASPSRYCPYCNLDNRGDMTDEHVIPKSIGGDQRTIIRVCKPCNDNAGQTVDSLLSSDEWLRLNALLSGVSATRHSKLESTTTLKDGRRLKGSIYFSLVELQIVMDFEPSKKQSDGSLWLSEKVIEGPQSLPANINVFQRDMVKYWGIDCPPVSVRGIEPALVKILFGFIYLDQGKDVVSSPAFDVMRFCLNGTLHESVQCNWLLSPMTWGESTVQKYEHAIWFECPASGVFRAGIALFGIGMNLEIKDIGCSLPNRCCSLAARVNRHSVTGSGESQM